MKKIPRSFARLLIPTFLAFVFGPASARAATDVAPLSRLKPAAGYRLEVFAPSIPGARSLAVSPAGTVFIGTRGDEVYAWKKGRLLTLAKFLDSPNGVAFRDGSLYVAEISRILRFENVEARIDAMMADPEKALEYRVLYKNLPTDRAHGWKFIAFGPDGFLYVPVGAPCNLCEKKDPRYASLLRFKNLDGSDPEVFASGIRNTVGFAWHPKSKQIWFTDNGRDNLGEDIPSDELNTATRAGENFGFPYCHQGDLSDPEFGKKRPCTDFKKPEAFLGAHVAALGMRFLDDSSILIAEHGSWNRTQPIGYRVVRVRIKDGKAQPPEPFLDGFLAEKNEVLGRPVDVEVLPDRSVLISDDTGNRIYRMVPTTAPPRASSPH